MKRPLVTLLTVAVLTGCGAQSTEIPAGTKVNARQIGDALKVSECRYMLPDGSVTEIDYSAIYDRCPSFAMVEVE